MFWKRMAIWYLLVKLSLKAICSRWPPFIIRLITKMVGQLPDSKIQVQVQDSFHFLEQLYLCSKKAVVFQWKQWTWRYIYCK